MLRAATLVHKGAMEIAIHAIRSFARHFSNTHSLAIHTDFSVQEEDQHLLLQAAIGMQVKIVTAQERTEFLSLKLLDYPNLKEFLNKGGIYTKLEIPMFEEAPYFFFDSDIIWLRSVTNFEPHKSANAFSTESWSWYNGITKEGLWISAKTPRRVNSGFYYIAELFPYEKMEDMLKKKMFDATISGAGDQEIFAYLYNDMEYFHPQDLKRSRVGSIYQLHEENCAALHFPGKMWMQHMDQIKQLSNAKSKPAIEMRFQPSFPISHFELMRMRLQASLGRSTLLAKPFNIIRKLRRAYR